MTIAAIKSARGSLPFRPCTRYLSACTELGAWHHNLPPKPELPDDEILHKYLKGSGPGGQKINKTNSAVQLTHLPTGIVVKSQDTRSRSQNHNHARRLLAEKVDELRAKEEGRQTRDQIKGERVARKKASASKKSNRKYRALEEAKHEQAGDTQVEAADGNVTDGEDSRISDAAKKEDIVGKQD